MAERRIKVKQRLIANGVPLRIEPLGASITYGIASSDGNGYRKTLRERLRWDGNKVNMVGGHPNGTMKDNDCEGWPGYVVDTVRAKGKSIEQFKPNLVLVNVGTNDAGQNIDIANTGKRMDALLADVYTWSPRTTVVLSALLPSKDATAQSRVLLINKQYKELADSLQSAGKRIVYLDSQDPVTGLKADDISADKTHPTDAGYVKFAKLWYAAIRDADRRGFIQKPDAVAGLPDDGGDE